MRLLKLNFICPTLGVRFSSPSIKTGSPGPGARCRRWLTKSGRSLDGTAPTHIKGLQAKKSPAASAFAAQPLGDSLKTRRLSRFCPFGAAPCLLRANGRQGGDSSAEDKELRQARKAARKTRTQARDLSGGQKNAPRRAERGGASRQKKARQPPTFAPRRHYHRRRRA